MGLHFFGWLWLLFSLLAPFPRLVASTTLDYRNLRSFELENTSTVEAAAAYWKEFNRCHPLYFDNPLENQHRMNLSDWYRDTIRTMFANHSQEYSKKGEAELFVRLVSGENDFACNGLEEQCKHEPSCKNVVGHLERTHKGISPNELMDISRKSWFAVETIVALNKVGTATIVGRNSFVCPDLSNVLQDLLTTVQLNEGQLAHKPVVDFTTQANNDADKLCSLIKKIVDFTSKLIQNMNSFGWGLLPGASGGQSSASGDSGGQDSGGGGTQLPSLSSSIDSGLDLIESLTRHLAESADMDAEEKWHNTRNNDTNGELRMDQSYATGIYGSFGGDRKNENLNRGTQMLNWIQDSCREMKRHLDKSLAEIMKGGLSNGGPHNWLYIWAALA